MVDLPTASTRQLIKVNKLSGRRVSGQRLRQELPKILDRTPTVGDRDDSRAPMQIGQRYHGEIRAGQSRPASACLLQGGKIYIDTPADQHLVEPALKPEPALD